MALAGTPPSHDALKTLDGVDISQSHLLLGPRLTTSTTGTTGTTGIEATTQITSESGTSRDSEAPPPGTAHAHVDDRPLFFQSVPGGQLGVMRLGMSPQPPPPPPATAAADDGTHLNGPTDATATYYYTRALSPTRCARVVRTVHVLATQAGTRWSGPPCSTWRRTRASRTTWQRQRITSSR